MPRHYVPHNAITAVPSSFVAFDTEAVQTNGVQTFRLAVAHFQSPKTARVECLHSPSELWEWITAACTRSRTIVVAHNLAYDLRISCALIELPRLGWYLEVFNFDQGACWCTWSRGEGKKRRRLCMVDSFSWLPTNLEAIGAKVEVHKLDLPDWEDGDAAWEARCRRDVEILVAAWRRCVSFVEQHDLGKWRQTGAAQSWAAWRHRFMDYSVLVHDDETALSMEREASWTGRCEAWRHGKLDVGPYTEWDLECAYAHIGVDCGVPVELCGTSMDPHVGDPIEGRAFLRQVRVEDSVHPTLPARDETGHIFWPVGTFQTTVWDHELKLARDTGARVHVIRSWWYKTNPALKAFCDWQLDLLESTTDPLEHLIVKHWARAFIGRFGVRWARWENDGDLIGEDEIRLIRTLDEHGELGKVMQLGERRLRAGAMENGPDAVPAVMSWVMAECRVRLWKIMLAAGLDHVVYCDTDSVIVDPVGDANLREARIPFLRVKGRWNHVEVLGPRQLVLGSELRAAGVPRRATRARGGGTSWNAEIWSTLGGDLRRGRLDSVHVAPRAIRLNGIDRRRIHLEDGRTGAVRIAG